MVTLKSAQITVKVYVFRKALPHAITYSDEIAVPMVERCKGNIGEIDLHVAAMVTLWHTVDWIAHELGEDVDDVSNKAQEAAPDLDYIRAAANVHKHRFVKKSPSRKLAESEVLEICEGRPPMYRFRDKKSFPSEDLLLLGVQAFRDIFAHTPTSDRA
jgi:hypothetical protein